MKNLYKKYFHAFRIAQKVEFILRKLELEVFIKAMPNDDKGEKEIIRQFYTSNTVRLVKK